MHLHPSPGFRAPTHARSRRATAAIVAALALGLAAVGADPAAAATVADVPSAGPAGPVDGRIAFVSGRTGNDDVYSMNADGTDVRNLTSHPARDADPAYSPDGTQVFFTSDRTGNGDIFVVNAAGGEAHNLTQGPHEDTEPAISPDGREVAFSSYRDGEWKIYIMPIHNPGAAHRLTANDGTESNPTFSPDGQRVAFNTSDKDGGSQIASVRRAGGGYRRLTVDGDNWDPAYAPDGAHIAFTSNRDFDLEIYEMTAAGHEEHNLTSNPEADDRDAAYSPRGDRIVFASDRNGEPKEPTSQIYRMRADGSGQERLTRPPDWDYSPSWGSGGDELGCVDIDRNGTKDNDTDALCDNWELFGIDADGDGEIDLPLHRAPFHADRFKRDIFVEIDWMRDSGHSHDPDLSGLSRVTGAFAARGITLHPMRGEGIPEINPVALEHVPGPANDFFDLKSEDPNLPCDGYFGMGSERADDNCKTILEARRRAFRYAIFGHDQAAPYEFSSGRGERGGNDLMVTLGAWSRAAIAAVGGRAEAEAGTFMHELGHTLGLGHGGAGSSTDDVNCKPNYLSVMNYTLQFVDMDPTRPLDFSDEDLGPLDETALNERVGIRGPSGRRVVFGVFDTGQPPIQLPEADGAIDWNGNGVDTDADATIAGIEPDPNYLAGVKGCAKPGVDSVLDGSNDWKQLGLGFRDSEFYADRAGDAAHEPELTAQDVLAQARAVDFDADGASNADDRHPADPSRR